ncbi:MAG: acyltransferase [Pseudomonadota bacterium]
MGRIGWIDAVRGIGCMLVIIIHFYHDALQVLWPTISGSVLVIEDHRLLIDTLRNYADIGWRPPFYEFILGGVNIGKLGVILFFLVSGFVVPFSLREGQHALTRFSISRFFRLYPIYWVSLILILLAPIPIREMSTSDIAMNFTMFQKFFFIPDLNGVAWTLQIELAFYIICAALFWMGWLGSPAKNLIVAALFAACAIGFAVIRSSTSFSAPIALPLSLTLMFAAHIWRKFLLKEAPVSPLLLAATLVTVFAGVIIACAIGYGDRWVQYVATYVTAIVAFGVVSTGLVRIAFKPLLGLGTVSYSAYLLHPVVGKLTIPPFIAALVPILGAGSYSALILVSMLLSIAVTLLVSWVTYNYIERPSISFGRDVFKRVRAGADRRSVQGNT